eukprot:gene12309-12531_t
MRIRLGMFDPPALLPAYNGLSKRDLKTKASTALNREAAAKGMVLLTNNNGPLLPLALSDYVGRGSILAGTGLNTGQVVYEAGCSTTNCSETDFTRVESLAKKAKVTVLVLGTLGWDRLDPG